MQGLQDIQSECGSAPDFGNCFAAQMRIQGASAQAVASTKLLLINGSPRVVDVDDISLLPKNALADNPKYTALSKQYPNITIFPGNRSGTVTRSYKLYPAADNASSCRINY